jgi:hypothetical protein
MTGGIMAVWCKHMICVGWHCIPLGEGRNDAFSALYTHWQKAPRIVIYDFACALAPYCMVREPAFFKDTLFLIDEFHSKGHTRCTAACMTSTYRKYMPEIMKLNTSLAECGNAGMQRVKKPVSYMSQRHAAAYVGAFLQVWNRTRQRNTEHLSEGQDLSDLMESFNDEHDADGKETVTTAARIRATIPHLSL